MPRKYSATASVGDTINPAKINNINSDIDDIYSTGWDNIKVERAVSGTALRIDISAGHAQVGATIVSYAGATNVVVTNSATNYIMIDNTGTIQINTTGWNSAYCPLFTVVCAGGIVTNIVDYRPSAFGGNILNANRVSKDFTAGENITAGQAA